MLKFDNLDEIYFYWTMNIYKSEEINILYFGIYR